MSNYSILKLFLFPVFCRSTNRKRGHALTGRLTVIDWSAAGWLVVTGSTTYLWYGSGSGSNSCCYCSSSSSSSNSCGSGVRVKSTTTYSHAGETRALVVAGRITHCRGRRLPSSSSSALGGQYRCAADVQRDGGGGSGGGCRCVCVCACRTGRRRRSLRNHKYWPERVRTRPTYTRKRDPKRSFFHFTPPPCRP